MSGKLSDADAKAFVECYQPLYFNDATSDEVKEKLGIGSRLTSSKQRTERKVEKYVVEELGKYKESDYKIQKEFVAWKSGELEGVHLPDKTDEQGVIREPEPLGDISIFGNKIKNLDEYIDAINGIIEELKALIEADKVSETYNILVNLQKEKKVKTFGSVYIITLIYFLSGGMYPIYDKFAHKAVKALYFGFNPRSIYVNGAPGKTEVETVMAMYKEYLFLLEGVFGTYHISREQDQALWVYGHSYKGYKDAPDIGFKDFK
jgi:hypothetical protein